MATVLSGNQVKLSDGKIVNAQQGGWYDGQQFWDGKLGATNVISNPNQQGFGQQVSNDVVAQTNPNNVSYIQSQIQANQIKAPIQTPTTQSSSLFGQESLSAEVNKYRQTLDTTLSTRKAEVDSKLADLRLKEQETLTKMEPLTKPFREELETTERERLYINKNFEENQKLVDELESLLNEGNALIKQQQEVTGLAAVRNPRIQQTMNDVAARTGVIEAVINARNGQIAQAQNLIDRSINAINADRQDQLNYYSTILNLNNRDILSLDEESKTLANEQLDLLKTDLSRSQATADYVKSLMINPDYAQLMGEAGVSLNDSVETINQKVSTAQVAREVREQSNAITLEGGVLVPSPVGIPTNQLRTFTASNGQTYYYKMPGKTGSLSDSIFTKFLEESGLGGNISDAAVVPEIINLASSAVAPSFTPTMGIGSIYTDNLGRKWQYTNQGWVLKG